MNGNATSLNILEEPLAIYHIGDLYFFFLDTRHYTPGTYVLIVYGDAFAAQQIQVISAPEVHLQSCKLSGT